MYSGSYQHDAFKIDPDLRMKSKFGFTTISRTNLWTFDHCEIFILNSFYLVIRSCEVVSVLADIAELLAFFLDGLLCDLLLAFLFLLKWFKTWGFYCNLLVVLKVIKSKFFFKQSVLSSFLNKIVQISYASLALEKPKVKRKYFNYEWMLNH
jgi:hypothetical protein